MQNIETGMAKQDTSNVKVMTLIALVVQNAGLAVIMRYSLVFQDSSNKYMTSTAVLMAELMKLTIASIACFMLDAGGKWDKFVNIVKNEGGGLNDWGKLSVPSVLYTVQNSLQYTAMSMLSAPVFQVCYQMKIITTALFSVVLLNRHISAMQWGSVFSLAVGVALVQISQQNSDNANEQGNSVLGLVAVTVGCMTSGFAGVYFEMVLKSSRASIWLRNIQLAFIGIFMASASCLLNDYDGIFNTPDGALGFFRGYNNIVWGVITFQAAGGLIVAMVVKYADNIIKNFATSFSILLSAMVSAYLFNDVQVNFFFVLGASTVMGATYAFGYKPPVRVVSRHDLEDLMKDSDDREGLLAENGDRSP